MLNFRTFDIELFDDSTEKSTQTNTDTTTAISTGTTTESDKLEINEIIMFSIFGVFCAASLALVAYGIFIRNNYIVISSAACVITLRKLQKRSLVRKVTWFQKTLQLVKFYVLVISDAKF